MEVLYAIVGPVVESLMVPIKRHLGYLISSTKYVNDMGNKMKQLDGTSIDVKKRIESNNINNREIPTRVPGWLDEVERIKNDVESISRNRIGCFNMKTRYQTARKATNIIMEIESLTKENHDIAWTDIPKPPGRVYSNKVSTSASSSGGDAHSDFKSRDEIFKEALEFLKQDHKSIQVLAICGMGGVGKTTMMEQLKEVVVDQKLFKWVVKVVIGQKPNMLLIQKAIAEHVGQPLTEETLTIRADILRKKYGHMLDGGKILVILDDVWEKIELKDIGLSPFPNGCKLILTSREENVCTQTAVEACCDLKVLKVLVLKEEEAQNFFSQITGVSKEDDPQLHQIGCDIVRKCGYLPLAIKLIATTLKFQKEPVWRNTRKRLKNNVLVKNVEEIIKISYDHLREEEDKAIFLLCGLFPDDFNIPIEDLARYAWGLKLWKEFDTFGDARDQIDRCVSNLKSANMLMDSDHDGCVKMHDLVLAFVLGSVSKGHHPWIINHGDATKMSGTEIMSKSCKRVSLTCTGMSEFPIDFGFPKLSLLKLMQGDKSLMFPEDFYAKMEELEVVAYEKMQYPLLPRSPQCSINLRTFCLHDCSLMFDLSPIGDLISLEVLSFAYCHIRRLPSTIGNLKKLKLLDLTRCVDLHIDEGVLKGLTKLEELYMRGLKEYVNYDELAEVSKNLFAFEFEFSNNNAFGKKISFKKLERFRISMGRLLGNVYEKIIQYSFENTLKLVTNRSELVESGVNELFMKTEVLHLEVNDMNDFEDVLAESRHPHQDCFNNLRVLDVFKCANLKYLFEVSIPNGLKKLEYLTISSCPVLKALVYLENTRAGTIDFPKLKSLSLDELPELVGLCNIVNVIELPELVKLELDGLPKFNSVYSDYEGTTCSSSNGILSILNKKVVIPKLETLMIQNMENLKEIWAWQLNSSEDVYTCILREIEVIECNNLMNLFPKNPMPLLHHLERLEVNGCGCIEVLFEMDLGCVGENDKSRLRSVYVDKSNKLKEIWRVKGVNTSDNLFVISSFQAVESIDIRNCETFRNIFTLTANDTHVSFDFRALTRIHITKWDWAESNSQQSNVISKDGEISQVKDNVAFSSNLMLQSFNHLRQLELIENKGGVEVVFEIESATNQQLLPHLQSLRLYKMETMTRIWKCNCAIGINTKCHHHSYSTT